MFIVLVYLGARTPAYVFDNLRYIKSQFPDKKLFLISDSELAIKKAEKIGAQGWLYEENSSESKEIKSKSALPMDFRDGFWFSTTARFFALCEFMRKHPGERVLQVEADVWLSPNFPYESFETLDSKFDIAFPLETDSTGAASLLYIRDEGSAELFESKVRELISVDSVATDMTILGQMYIGSHPTCLILPSIPRESTAFNSVFPKSLLRVASEGIDFFGGIFDAVTYGLYLSGEDPRNHRGKLYRYRRQEGHLVHCDKLKFAAGPTGPYVQDERPIPLFNIHIHTKSRGAWKNDFIREELGKIIRNSTKGEEVTRDYRLTIKMICQSLNRRLKATYER